MNRDMNHTKHSHSPRFRIFKTIPLFLFLLPLLFVLHGFTLNYSAVPIGDSLLLALEYIGLAVLVCVAAWYFYRNWIKASLLAFAIIFFQLYFGQIQDGLKSISASFISQYRFLLPTGCLLLLLLIVVLKKQNKTFYRLTAYLNVLLIVLLLIEVVRLGTKVSSLQSNKLPEQTTPFIECKQCARPDIYFILLDQYAGRSALKDVFNFDNSGFEQALKQRGFFIASNSRSNYNLTPFSMASTLDMNYLGKEMGVKNNLNIGYTYDRIRNSRVIRFLGANGYQFYNYSVFDFPSQPAHKYGAFFPYGTKLITAQTFTGRLKRDLRSAILEGKLGSRAQREKIAYEHLHFNNDIFELTRALAASQHSKPRFVYAHFMMPHYPYYFDSKGRPLPIEKLSGFRNTDAHDYIEYLQYGNREVLELVDHILSRSSTPPIIMLLADHGFRHPEKNSDRKYDFINLNAIFLPQQDYSRFYEGMSNVNHFRIVFNTCFNQQLPLLRDSTIDLWD
jgi:hypothetical protein